MSVMLDLAAFAGLRFPETGHQLNKRSKQYAFAREWRNGRRAGFRCQCPKGRGGSNPPSRTQSKHPGLWTGVFFVKPGRAPRVKAGPRCTGGPRPHNRCWPATLMRGRAAYGGLVVTCGPGDDGGRRTIPAVHLSRRSVPPAPGRMRRRRVAHAAHLQSCARPR